MSTPNQSTDKPLDLAIGVPSGGDGKVTARMAGGLVDMNLSISPRKNPVPVMLRSAGHFAFTGTTEVDASARAGVRETSGAGACSA